METLSIKLPSKRYVFHVAKEEHVLNTVIPALPDGSFSVRMISEGDVSSIGFVYWLAQKTKIEEMTASTLRVGKKHLAALEALNDSGKLGAASFIVGSVMKNDSKLGLSYGYFDALKNACEKRGWQLCVASNHSKVILFDTAIGKFVLETSSNLNDSPNREQFAFERSAELYDFYKNFFDSIIARGGEKIDKSQN